MELRVGAGRAGGIARLLVAQHVVKAAADAVPVLVGGTLGRIPGRAELQRLACFQHVVAILGVVAQQGLQRCDGLFVPQRLTRADKGAGAHAAFQHAAAGKLLYGLAQRRARDTQLLGQRPLGRQLGAALELGALDQLQQLLGNAVGQADGRHGVGQEFQVVGIIHGNT